MGNYLPRRNRRPIPTGAETRGRTVPNEGGAIVQVRVGILGGADDDVVIPIAVHIPGGAHRGAKAAIETVALGAI